MNPNWSTIFAQLVPFPLPGPPKTNTTFTFFANNNSNDKDNDDNISDYYDDKVVSYNDYKIIMIIVKMKVIITSKEFICNISNSS